jgi:hypothetical protein
LVEFRALALTIWSLRIITCRVMDFNLFQANAGTSEFVNLSACLLTHPDGHPPDMALQTGYSPKTVQMTLAEMAYSRKIYAARKGREKHYREDGADWALLRVQGDPGTAWPKWVGWPR